MKIKRIKKVLETIYRAVNNLITTPQYDKICKKNY